MLQLGLAVKGLARPLTAEAVDAIAASRILSTLEVCAANFSGADGADVKKRLLDAVAASPRLSIPTFHCTFDPDHDISQTDMERRRAAVELFVGEMMEARDFDASTLVVHPSFDQVPDEERPRRIEALKVSMSEMEERTRRYGMRVALELLPGMRLGRTPEELLDFTADFGDGFGFCLDTNHLTGMQGRLAETVGLLGDRLYDIHVSDYFGGDECHSLPGDGTNDWKAFAAALDAIGYTGPFTYEVRIQGTPAERMRAVEENFAATFATA